MFQKLKYSKPDENIGKFKIYKRTVKYSKSLFLIYPRQLKFGFVTSINRIRNSRRILDTFAKHRAIIHTDSRVTKQSIVSQTCSFHECINFVTCNSIATLLFRSSSRIVVIVISSKIQRAYDRMKEEKKKKRIVDRLFNFKASANYRALRINFEFSTKKDSQKRNLLASHLSIDFCPSFAQKKKSVISTEIF